MLGFLIAVISGTLMSVQGVFNSEVAKNSSIWVMSGFVQLTALIACVVMWFVTGRPDVLGMFHLERKYALLGGVIGAMITYTVVKSIDLLGTAPAILIIVVSQTTIAYIIEIFGLFGSEKVDFSWTKLFGLLVTLGGIALFCLSGTKK